MKGSGYGSLQPGISSEKDGEYNADGASAVSAVSNEKRDSGFRFISFTLSVLLVVLCFELSRSSGLGSEQTELQSILSQQPKKLEGNSSFYSPLLPKWAELQWFPLATSDNTTLQDQTQFIGYLLFCEVPSNPVGAQFVYQSVTTDMMERSQSPEDFTCPQAPNHTLVSPVIRLVPGVRYTLVLINRSSEPTNIHTHGLHISGVGTVDDVTRIASPGSCLVYQYFVMNDADVGTFVYHSHLHPMAAHQVFNGAYGFLVVDESPDTHSKFYPSHLKEFFQNEIMLQYVSVLNKTSGLRTNFLNGLVQTDSGSPIQVLRISRYEWYYLRVSFLLLSDRISYLEFHPKDACEVRIVAYDGMYRSKVPSEHTVHRHMLTLSSRVDLALRCSVPADLHFHQGSLTNATRLVSVQTMEQVVRRSKVVPSPYWDVSVKSQWNPRRPYSMDKLAKLQVGSVDNWTLSMDDILNNGTKALSINQMRWDPQIPIRSIKLGQLAEWNLLHTPQHPFHLHVNHMQIVEPGGCGYRFEEGEYFDTITSKRDSCHVRIYFRDYAGRVVAHCHKLTHEDRNMMVWINVTDGPGTGVLASPEVQCYEMRKTIQN